MANVLTESAQTSESTQIVSPVRLAHIVLRSSRFHELLDWYKLVLNSHIVYESEGIAFLAYDEEHHRIAVINVPNLAEQPYGVAGVHHYAFTYENLPTLLSNYERLKERGVEPLWCTNHGPTTSMYYGDPDGNQVELQVDNYDTVEEAGEFFFSDQFATNPIGVDFNPAELIARLKTGEDERAMKLRPASGPRGVEDIRLPR